MTTTPAARTPEIGQDLYLDGLWYLLGDEHMALDSAGKVHILREFLRPDEFDRQVAMALRSDAKRTAEYRALPQEQRAAALDTVCALPEKDKAYRLNFNYKQEGDAFESHLVWLDPAALLEALDEQVDQLVAGGGAAARVWARAARKLQRDSFADRAGGCWVIGEAWETRPVGGPSRAWRLLLKPTCVRLQSPTGALLEAPVTPTDPDEAATLAHAILVSDDVPPLVATLTSWVPPAGHQIVRW